MPGSTLSQDPKNNMHARTFKYQVARMTLGSLALVALNGAAPAFCRADQDDAFNFAGGAALRYDDNLFRLPSGGTGPVPDKSSRSDFVYTVYAGLRVDKPYAQQRVQFDVTATQYSYRNNDFLNFTALDYRGAWLWSLTPHLTGNLSTERVSELTSYADLQNTTHRNIRTNTTQRFDADWQAGGGWHLVGGASHRRSSADEAALTAVGNHEQNSLEGGIKYVSPANNSLTVLRRESRGNYIGRSLDAANLLDTGYDQSDSEMRAFWQVTGHSTLDARLGYMERTHRNFAQRDFSGATGSMSYQWAPTGKLRFTLATGRNLLSYQESTNSYYVSDFVAFTPAWLLTDKTTVSLRLNLARNDYRGAVGTVATPTMREDRIRAAELRAVWRPLRTVDVDGYIAREQRSTNLPGLPYQDNVVGVSSSLRF